MTDTCIAIAMATYNGEDFILDQIRSIQLGKWQKWRLIIRDDGSSDDTVKLLKHCAATDERISILEDDLGNVGYAQNFNLILQYIYQQNFELFALADQDDYWHSDKLTSLAEHIESVSNAKIVHSDLIVADEQLNLMHQSFYKQSRLSPKYGRSINYLLMENYIPGCTILGNRALLEKALPIPIEMKNHDWWLALHAALYGEIHYVSKQLIQYRQHSKNTIGQKTIWGRIVSNEFISRLNHQVAAQAAYLTAICKDKKHPDNNDVANFFSHFIAIVKAQKSALFKVMQLYKLGARTHHLLRWIIIMFALRKLAKSISK
jgi:glycosyltransferase involved in cell wall biosynthesis